MKQQRSAFFISDGTGITVEQLGASLLAQFDAQINFTKYTLRFINNETEASKAVSAITAAAQQDHLPPIVFESVVDEKIRAIIARSPGKMFDVFDYFLAPLERALKCRSNHSIGSNRMVEHQTEYHARMEAVNFTLNHDDGIAVQDYAQADIILVGVSRSGKTPTALYLALQFGCFTANYPLTDEDHLESLQLPTALVSFRDKLFGLIIDSQRLHQIRQQRRPDSDYSMLSRCHREVQQAKYWLYRHHIPHLDSTHLSVEEIASRIIQHSKGSPD